MCATARIIMPKSRVRLSAGRKDLSNEAQIMCFMAGANSIFIGEKLFTSKNSSYADDTHLFESLNIISSIYPLKFVPFWNALFG